MGSRPRALEHIWFGSELNLVFIALEWCVLTLQDSGPKDQGSGLR